MKLNILLRIIKFWIHLESLPENSIAKQCLIISSQLANETKTSFMLTVNEIIHNYKDIQHQSYNKTIQTNDLPTIKNNLQKLKCHTSNNLKRHQLEIIRSNRKLCFYSIFKTDVSKSHYLEQVRNLKHRRAVAKLRSGNHSLRIESGRHCVPKLPEYLRICQHCRSNQIENENHFLFHCDRYKTIRQQITSDIVAELRRPKGPPSGAQYSSCRGKIKETHELIFSWLSWLAVLLVGAYARRRRRRRSCPTYAWRPYSKNETYSPSLRFTSLILDIPAMIN